MSIQVTCQCGHQFRVKDKYAGSSGKCPGCGELVQVPGGEGDSPTVVLSKAQLKGAAPERRQAARKVSRQMHRRPLPEVPELELASLCHEGKEPGRDYFDCVQLQDGSWGAVMGTVNAHALDAALSTLELRAAVHALALGYSDPSAILTLLNRLFVADWPQDRSATVLVARLDLQTRQLTYASAAHPTAYVVDARGNVKWSLESADCPIGLLANTMYGASSPLPLEAGESLVLLSDGLLRAASPDGGTLGGQKLLQTLPGSAGTARAIIENVESLVGTGAKKDAASVDQSALVVRIK